MKAQIRHPKRVMRSTEDDGTRTLAAKQAAQKRKVDRQAARQ